MRVPTEVIGERENYPCEPQRWDPFLALLWCRTAGVIQHMGLAVSLSCKELELQALLEEIVLPRGGSMLVSIIPVSLHGGVLDDFYFGLTVLLLHLGQKLSFNICNGS